jgi:hypothetical protein
MLHILELLLYFNQFLGSRSVAYRSQAAFCQRMSGGKTNLWLYFFTDSRDFSGIMSNKTNTAMFLDHTFACGARDE